MAAAIGAVVPNCPSWGPQFTTNKAGQAQEPGPGPGIIINNWGRISRSSRLNAKAKSKVKRKRSRSSSSNSGGFEIIMVCGAATATATASGPSGSSTGGKQVWIWTENKEVMTAAVQRAGWNTFIFQQQQQQLQLQQEELTLHSSLSSSIAQLFIDDDQGEGGRALFDADHNKVATFLDISSPDQLQNLQQTLNQQPLEETNNVVVVNLLDWQVIPAENIVAAIQRTATHKTVFAVSNTPSQAQLFLEALEHGLGGVVLKTDRVHHILHLKDYLDRRNSQGSVLELTKARVTNIQMVGMGDRVCVDLCSIMAPGEGLLVGSFARGLFLVHSECLESSYISSRPFRVNAGPVHAYAAIPGDKTSYLSELKAGKEVIIFDQNGRQRTAVIGRVKIETRPLVLVEAKRDEDDQTCYSILLQNAETVALISSDGVGHKAIPVTCLKLGDVVLLRMQGGARHTGIEIQEFIVEK